MELFCFSYHGYNACDLAAPHLKNKILGDRLVYHDIHDYLNGIANAKWKFKERSVKFLYDEFGLLPNRVELDLKDQQRYVYHQEDYNLFLIVL